MEYRIVKQSIYDEASRLLREWWTVEEGRKFMWWTYWRPLSRLYDDSAGGSIGAIEFQTLESAQKAVENRKNNHPVGHVRTVR